MTGQVLALAADYLTEPFPDTGIIDVIVVNPAFVARVVGRIYVPTDFDTKEKALSGANAAEKGLK